MKIKGVLIQSLAGETRCTYRLLYFTYYSVTRRIKCRAADVQLHCTIGTVVPASSMVCEI